MKSHNTKPHRVTIHHRNGSVHYTVNAQSKFDALRTAPMVAQGRGIKDHAATAVCLEVGA
jgi:hypothetical protein